MLSYHLTSYFASGLVPQRRGATAQVAVPYQAFQTANAWMVVGSFTDRMWKGVCRAVERADWENDDSLATLQGRIERKEEVVSGLEKIFSTQPAAYWVERLEKEGVPSASVNTIDEVVQEPQVVARKMIVALQPSSGPSARNPDIETS